MSMEVITRKLIGLVEDELADAIQKNGSFHSAHEAYAVLLEEWDEAIDDLKVVDDSIQCFWSCVKNDMGMDGEADILIQRSISAAAELIQVAAMAKKYKQWEESR